MNRRSRFAVALLQMEHRRHPRSVGGVAQARVSFSTCGATGSGAGSSFLARSVRPTREDERPLAKC